MAGELSAADREFLEAKDRLLAAKRAGRVVSTIQPAQTTPKSVEPAEPHPKLEVIPDAESVHQITTDRPAFHELLEDADERDPTKSPLDSLVPPGEEYVVAFESADFRVFRGRAVWYSKFRVIEPAKFEGWLLLRVWNVPEDWTAKDKKGKTRPLDKRSKACRPGKSSNLYADFAAVTGQRPRLKTFHPADLFSGVHLRVAVVDVGEKSDAARYSRIDRVIERVAGCSPARR